MTDTPLRFWLATKNTLPSGERRTSTGDPPTGMVPVNSSLVTSRRSSWPENSQDSSICFPSAVKSPWSTPSQGAGMLFSTAQVWGSRTSSRRSASATTMAWAPSGGK